MGNIFGTDSNVIFNDISNGDRSEIDNNPITEKKKLIFIEGNVSCGKSTLINNLKGLGYTVYEEPVDRWLNEYKNDAGVNSLELFYGDMKANAFKFEMLVMRTRWEKIKEALSHDSKLIFIERSLLTDVNTFALNLRESGLMETLDWKLYMECFHDKMEDIEHLFQECEISYLYLKTDPEVCYTRKFERKRVEEDSVPLEYFKALGEKHDNWLVSETHRIKHKGKEYPVCTVDGNKSVDDVINSVVAAISELY